MLGGVRHWLGQHGLDVGVCIGIAVAGYVALLAGNDLGGIAVVTFSASGTVFAVLGPALDGSVVGLLASLRFPRGPVLLGVVLAWLPVAFSWFVRGARVWTTGPITLVPEGPQPLSPVPPMHLDYSVLLIMLVVSGLASTLVQALVRWRRRVRR